MGKLAQKQLLECCTDHDKETQEDVETLTKRLPVLDGFQVPMKLQKVTISGAAYIKSVQGYFKPTLVVLTNSELYIYADVDSSKHSEMFVMSSGVFVQSLDAVEDPEIDIAQHNYDIRANKFYPVEILLSSQ